MGVPAEISEDIADHLDAIREHFKAPKVTLVVRAPRVVDGDLIMTDDDPKAAITAIRRLVSRGEAAPASELEAALRLADRILDRPGADPDDDLAVLARQLLRAHEWLPIASAPRDGTHILLAFGQDLVAEGWWEDNDADPRPWKFLDSGCIGSKFKGGELLNGSRDEEYGPSLWRPLPEARQ